MSLPDRMARRGAAVDDGAVPLDAKSRLRRRDGVSIGDREARRRELVELRDVLDPRRIRNRGGEGDMKLHQEVGTDGDVESFREMGHLEPRRDAADARA